MNQDQFINKMAHLSGKSRKEIIDVLKQMSAMPEVQKELKRIKSKK